MLESGYSQFHKAKEKDIHSLDGFKNDEDRDENQEDAIGEAGEGLNATVAIGKAFIWIPSRHHGCEKAHTDRHTVKSHVYRCFLVS